MSAQFQEYLPRGPTSKKKAIAGVIFLLSLKMNIFGLHDFFKSVAFRYNLTLSSSGRIACEEPILYSWSEMSFSCK